MEDSGTIFDDYINELAAVYPGVRNISIPRKISDNLTLSTMHGCPPDEIEKIGMYLIKERKYHTVIKLNPTLLGPVKLRSILNEKLGFETEVPDIAFEHDLKYDAALSLIKNLRQAANQVGVEFGIKLTNTLESVNKKGVLPEDQTMNYMSGRALHPLAINVAAALQKDFNGELDISLSGGADAFNVVSVLKCGISPITVCSDVLKPGGYGRMYQYITAVKSALKTGETYSDLNEGNEFLFKYADEVVTNPAYMKDSKPWDTIKTNRKLEWFDCISAPCEETCPTHQNIPGYMYHVSRNEPEKALDLIRASNPFPYTTGLACDHKCVDKCTRLNYDSPLLIREIKRYAAYNGDIMGLPERKPLHGRKVSIIGAGPGGLSCAWFLSLNGYSVTVYEGSPAAGGMLRHALPDFRMLPDGLDNDLKRIKAMGVDIRTGVKVGHMMLSDLRSSNDFIYISVGAAKGKKLGMEGEDTPGVMDFLDFLRDVKDGKITSVPENTVIIGGGNSAVDAARSAWRLGARVRMIYRRTKKEMPADREEIVGLMEEGIEILELRNPLRTISENGKLVGIECNIMQLGEPDSSGRRRPEVVPGNTEVIKSELCITAIGQDTALDFLKDTGVEVTKYGTIKCDTVTHETTIQGIFAGGDVVHGPSSIIQAIADGKEAAFAIMKRSGIEWEKESRPSKDLEEELKVKRATRVYGPEVPHVPVENRRNFQMFMLPLSAEDAVSEASRCLYCDEFCNVCVTVCPNRANISYVTLPASYRNSEIIIKGEGFSTRLLEAVAVKQAPQILNLGDSCNECGNCTTFCPTKGRPFADKPRLYLSREGFETEKESCMYFTPGVNESVLEYREKGVNYRLEKASGKLIYGIGDVRISLNGAEMRVTAVENAPEGSVYTLDKAIRLYVLLDAFETGLSWLFPTA